MFSSFLLKGIMKVHEIKKNEIFNVRFFNILFVVKKSNPIFEELLKYIMHFLVTVWDNK